MFKFFLISPLLGKRSLSEREQNFIFDLSFFSSWFWRILQKMSPSERQKLLYFATGSSVLPALDNRVGNNGTGRLSILIFFSVLCFRHRFAKSLQRLKMIIIRHSYFLFPNRKKSLTFGGETFHFDNHGLYISAANIRDIA